MLQYIYFVCFLRHKSIRLGFLQHKSKSLGAHLRLTRSASPAPTPLSQVKSKMAPYLKINFMIYRMVRKISCFYHSCAIGLITAVLLLPANKTKALCVLDTVQSRPRKHSAPLMLPFAAIARPVGWRRSSHCICDQARTQVQDTYKRRTHKYIRTVHKSTHTTMLVQGDTEVAGTPQPYALYHPWRGVLLTRQVKTNWQGRSSRKVANVTSNWRVFSRSFLCTVRQARRLQYQFTRSCWDPT